MSNDIIKGLEDALANSPSNIQLRKLLADTLLDHNKYEEACLHYQMIIPHADQFPDILYKYSIAYYHTNRIDMAIVMLEEFVEKNPTDLDALVLLSKSFIKENNISAAIDVYQKVQAIDPNFSDEELDKHLKVSDNALDEINSILEEPTKASVTFKDVGGMQKVKKEIDLKIIKPLQNADLYKAYGKKVGGGILLYGPPGCGKTFIAKATAGEVNAKFIHVSLNDILDMWMGNSEKNLHEVFENARQNTPCVLFFDEIDALGANRSNFKNTGGRNVINQFLQELDGAENDNDGVLILGATNTPWHLDPAFRRPGRFDRIIFIPPPDTEAREEILKLKLDGKPIGDIDYTKVAKKTEEYSGADMEAIIDIAIEKKLEASFEDGIPKPIETKDLVQGAKSHAPTTKEWFTSARNYALFSNAAGIYDDVLDYLKIKK
ncbi:AAA family ATPase [Flammeovirga yaeyamensis]|uniref:AAA family ATPase n=1 Tax=Flammeovirga yaeyamensis TaxID=367791 RepID=A0AAX1N622_9BACT|nr:AAA family ATPase [Flammeovirga yaeyamensis]MBB3701284.1 SpoVK/Ycf46/Vps4 family AAA+-type ATPase [Flammeovirga yaeyamensis]NMF38246.1 AAA family ATPase [Flammeovirga yaeyamensis]QWG02657.1 AAA family ATPase [Flammeovirga yaeyamensis]